MIKVEVWLILLIHELLVLLAFLVQLNLVYRGLSKDSILNGPLVFVQEIVQIRCLEEVILSEGPLMEGMTTRLCLLSWLRCLSNMHY